jgi:hypothetical protein
MVKVLTQKFFTAVFVTALAALTASCTGGGTVVSLPTELMPTPTPGDSTNNTPLQIAPGAVNVLTGGSVVFVAVGGQTPYTFSILSGIGSVQAITGIYIAPGTTGSATIRVTDAAGTTSDATVTVQNGSGNGAPQVFIASPAANAVVGNTTTLIGICRTGLQIDLSGTGLASPSSTTCNGGTFSQVITFTAGSGNKQVTVTQNDSGSGLSGTDTRVFSSDIDAPTAASISINSAATHTKTAAVTLTLAATNADYMYITNTAGCASGGAWESYSTWKSWSLAQTNATATVYAKYKDVAGNETSCINTTIIHDDVAPTVTFSSPAVNTVAAGSLTITGSCDSGIAVDISGTGVNSASSTTCPAGTFSQSITLSSGDGAKVVNISQTDLAGNVG